MKWYAVCMNTFDTDLGTGSTEFEEAMKMAKEVGATEIVVVDDGEPVEVIDLLGEYKKYYLDLDPFDKDKFYLCTRNSNEVVHTGRFSEIGKWTEGWTDALDEYFERRLGIKPEEWEVG